MFAQRRSFDKRALNFVRELPV